MSDVMMNEEVIGWDTIADMLNEANADINLFIQALDICISEIVEP